jgi:hypothetical protein
MENVGKRKHRKHFLSHNDGQQLMIRALAVAAINLLAAASYAIMKMH